MSAAALEKRSGFRRDSQGSIISIAPVMDVGRSFFGHAQNISRSGMLIHTYMPIAEGDELELEFILPGTESQISCRAKVMWVGGVSKGGAKVSRGGMQFLDLDPVFAERIDNWASGEMK